MIMAGTMRVNEKGHLEVGGCDTLRLAEEFGTPLYVMDETLLRENCRRYVNALQKYYPKGKILFAGKAFLVKAMVRLVEEEGLSLDVVSGGELYTALQAGFPPERLYFHGNNKSEEEIQEALEAGTGVFVVDSLTEMEILVKMAGNMSKRAGVLIRIKPGIEAHTHDYIQTGQEDSKFGFGLEDEETMRAIQLALSSEKYIELKGFHCHIGSQIFDLEPYKLTVKTMVEFIARVKQETGYTAEQLDLGGGLGIRYTKKDDPPSIEAFVENIASTLKSSSEEKEIPLPELLLEPGRSIAGEAGIILYKVGIIKDVPGIRRYVSVDGGMMDNIRPALYDARYEASLANKAAEEPSLKVTIAGKACESGDILIEEVWLPPVEKNDLLAVSSSGAYGYSMASNYNRNPRPAVIFAKHGSSKLVVRRETYEDLVALDQ